MVKKPAKKLPAAPLGGNRATKKVVKNPLFEKTPKSFRIGGSVLPSRDLTRYVRWPRYIRMQRQKRILLMRLKVPPSINQFNHALDKAQASQLLKLLQKYSPETREVKKSRLAEEASAKAAGKTAAQTKKPMMLKYGLNHVTELIENKLAKLVVIAHDVDPIELVVWLPALCRKKEVPYCIVKGKSRLGQLVHKKNAACLAVTSVKKEDHNELESMCKKFQAQFNDNVEMRRKYGGGIMGLKSQHTKLKKERAIALEQAKKLGMVM